MKQNPETQRRPRASRRQNGRPAVPPASTPVREASETANVAVPRTLAAAVKVVAARMRAGGTKLPCGKKANVQNLTAQTLRRCPLIATEEEKLRRLSCIHGQQHDANLAPQWAISTPKP